jgi:diaminohydroxyphosphoribosylaminopyrimidine deaminase/5-amino-6-(5-phosphoribosylamino)uracil reductase
MTDADYILRTIALAQQGIGLASPGALVGAVAVKNEITVGEGFYVFDNKDHAEVIALRTAGNAARGSTVYTSLEPCSHTGRTPPCAQALIDAGVSRVVTAMIDPNPKVQGKGIEMLRQAGIEVSVGIHEEEARRVNEAFFVYKTQNRSFGILKIAMTLDGKIATRNGESKWITSEASRSMVQTLRHSVDAVITGSGTFLRDRPSMTDRTGLPRRRELLRIVMDRRGRLDPRDIGTGGWLIHRGSIAELIEELKTREVQSFMLECGPDLAFDALKAGIIDKIVQFIAPSIFGGRETPAIGGTGVLRLAEAIRLRDWSIDRVGPDLTITSYVHGNH